MAYGKSPWLCKNLLALANGATAWTPPATWYFALSSAPYDNTISAAASITELSGSGYARVAVTNNTTNFPAPTGTTQAQQVTGTDITTATATADWATAKSAYFVDSASGAGNVGYGGDLATWITVLSGGNFTAPAGTLLFKEN